MSYRADERLAAVMRSADHNAKRGAQGPPEDADITFSRFASVMDELEQNGRNLKSKTAIEALLRILEDDATGNLEAVQSRAKMFVDSCSTIGLEDEAGRSSYVPVEVARAGEPRPNEPAFYSKDASGQTVRCMPRNRAPQDTSQLQRIGRLVQQLEEESARFETMRRADQNLCESAITSDQCGALFTRDAAGNETPACDYYTTTQSSAQAQQDLKGEDAALKVLSSPHWNKRARNETIKKNAVGICVPNDGEMRRRVSVYSRRLNGLLDENNLLRKRSQEMLGSKLGAQGAGSVLAYNFQPSGSVTQKKIKALKHTYDRRRNNQQQILKLQEILRKYLEYLQQKEIKSKVETRSDDICQQIRTTLGDCLEQPGCAVIRRDPNHKDGDRVIRFVSEADRKEPLRGDSDPLAPVLGATHCRADDTGMLEKDKEPQRNAMDEPVPAFLAQELRALQRRERDLKGMSISGGWSNQHHKDLNKQITRLVDAGRVAPLSVSESNYLLGLSDPSFGLVDDEGAHQATSDRITFDMSVLTRIKEEYTQLLVDIRRLYQVTARLSELGLDVENIKIVGADTESTIGQLSELWREYSKQANGDVDGKAVNPEPGYGPDVKEGTNDKMIFQFEKRIDEDDPENKSRVASDDCTIDIMGKHRELTQQLFVVLGQARKINKLVRKAQSEDDGPGANVLSGGDADLYLTICRLKEIFNEAFTKDIHTGTVGKPVFTPGINGHKYSKDSLKAVIQEALKEKHGEDDWEVQFEKLANEVDKLKGKQQREKLTKIYKDYPPSKLATASTNKFQDFAKNCIDLTINVHQEDGEEETSHSDKLKFKDLFEDTPIFSGGAQQRYELFNYLQQYVGSREADILQGQTVLVHSDILKVPAQKQIEKLIFQTIGGSNDPVAADWNPVVITELGGGSALRPSPLKTGVMTSLMIGEGNISVQNFAANELMEQDSLTEEGRQLYVYNPIQEVSDTPLEFKFFEALANDAKKNNGNLKTIYDEILDLVKDNDSLAVSLFGTNMGRINPFKDKLFSDDGRELIFKDSAYYYKDDEDVKYGAYANYLDPTKIPTPASTSDPSYNNAVALYKFYMRFYHQYGRCIPLRTYLKVEDTAEETKKVYQTLFKNGDIQKEIKDKLALEMPDLTVLRGLEEYKNSRSGGKVKEDALEYRNKRTVVPDGIRNNGVIKAFLGGGQKLVEKEVSPFNPAELAHLGTYIVQYKPHRIHRQPATPYDHSDASSVEYWMGDDSSHMSDTTIGSGY